jgi:hypothetical protein
LRREHTAPAAPAATYAAAVTASVAHREIHWQALIWTSGSLRRLREVTSGGSESMRATAEEELQERIL